MEIPSEGRTVCENRASGIRTMVRAMAVAGLPPRRFADHVSWFQVTLHGPGATAPGTLSPARPSPAGRAPMEPRARARLILNALASSSLTRREIEAATGLSQHQVRVVLANLVGRGEVTVIGPARSPVRRYSLKAGPMPGAPE